MKELLCVFPHFALFIHSALHSDMKTVFYKELLHYDELNANDKIVYSFLIYKSITIIDCVFTTDGECLDLDILNDAISYGEKIDLYKISFRKLSVELNITLQTAYSSVQRLKSLSLIDDELIVVPKSIINGSYFDIDTDMEIKGELLIFYSFLKNKANYFGGYIDSFKYRIAYEMGITKIAVTKLLNRLYKLKLAERMPNGKLKVN